MDCLQNSFVEYTTSASMGLDFFAFIFADIVENVASMGSNVFVQIKVSETQQQLDALKTFFTTKHITRRRRLAQVKAGKCSNKVKGQRPYFFNKESLAFEEADVSDLLTNTVFMAVFQNQQANISHDAFCFPKLNFEPKGTLHNSRMVYWSIGQRHTNSWILDTS